MAGEHFPEATSPLLVERRAGRILTTRRRDHRLRAAPERPFERVGHETALIHPRRHGLQPERKQQVGDPRPARVLDDDAVAGPELRLQHSLDAVERTADDGDVALDPVRCEVGLRQTDQLRQPDRPTVELVLRIEPGQRRAERRQERGVGVTAGEVARVRRQRRPADHPQRRLGGDDRPAAPIRAHEAALLERAVSGGHRRRAHSQLVGQFANGGKARGRRQAVVGNRGFDLPGDRRGAGAEVDAVC